MTQAQERSLTRKAVVTAMYKITISKGGKHRWTRATCYRTILLELGLRRLALLFQLFLSRFRGRHARA